MKEIRPIESKHDVRIENMALCFLILALDHGADTLEYRVIDGIFRNGERTNGKLFEYPTPPRETQKVIYDFYRYYFEIDGDESSTTVLVNGQKVPLRFRFFESNSLDIELPSGGDRVGKYKELIDEFLDGSLRKRRSKWHISWYARA